MRQSSATKLYNGREFSSQKGGRRYERLIREGTAGPARHGCNIMLSLQRHSEDTLLKRPFATITLAILLMIPASDLSLSAQAQTPGIKAENGPITCRVLESFEEGKLGVRAIVFHQRDKADGPRLGLLLSLHSGKEMELETASGRRYRATIFRVKSCFGRGLALVPTSKLKLGEHDEFTLRLPGDN
jgi:hypothetical protein